jgi:hypothetical protein
MVLSAYDNATDALQSLADTNSPSKKAKFVSLILEASKAVAGFVDLLVREDPDLQKIAADIFEFSEKHTDELMTAEGRDRLTHLLDDAEEKYEEIAKQWW